MADYRFTNAYANGQKIGEATQTDITFKNGRTPIITTQFEGLSKGVVTSEGSVRLNCPTEALPFDIVAQVVDQLDCELGFEFNGGLYKVAGAFTQIQVTSKSADGMTELTGNWSGGKPEKVS